jgi:hypothetical protein
MTRTLALLITLAFAASTARAGEDTTPTADEIKQAQARLGEYLKTIKGAEAARVTALGSDGMGPTFRDHVLFGVMFPQYPVARVAPPPLSSSNVVAVPKKKDGKPVPITDAKSLEKFFKEHGQEVKQGAAAEQTLMAWLRASAELNQDGFYQFTVKADAPKVDGGTVTVTGSAPVDPKNGDKGQIMAALSFKDGKMLEAATDVKLSPGPRPRCQATKLLDPDPIVRQMAEDSIRVMGSAAKPYLDEQRAKASAELREAIDRVWKRIVEEGR